VIRTTPGWQTSQRGAVRAGAISLHEVIEATIFPVAYLSERTYEVATEFAVEEIFCAVWCGLCGDA
jgi:hypothetical protein